MNLIDWFRENAKWLAKDRPDLYANEAAAAALLDELMQRMREREESGVTSFGDYMILRTVEDGIDEWYLLRKLSSIVWFDNDPRALVSSWTENSGALKHGVDLPFVGEDFGDDYVGDEFNG